MRWNALVRHGLISTSLLGAAAGSASADVCNRFDNNQAVVVVLGLDLGDRVRPFGGVEYRRCVDERIEAMLRVEKGAGPASLIAGARIRPFEDPDNDGGYWIEDERDREDAGFEGGLAFDMRQRLAAHFAVTYGHKAAYGGFQGGIPFDGGPPRAALLVGLAPWEFHSYDEAPVPGRPLIRGGVRVRPGFAAPLAEIASAEARAVRDHFASSAQIEYSSVWTFLRLASELIAVGAPAELIAAALDAADDEVRHAELCAHAAGDIALLPLPPSMAQARFTRRSPHALAILAAEAWSEGCLNETAAAEEARLASGEAEGPARAMLASIADDETRHAELSWRVLAWIFAIAPAVATEALATVAPGAPIREEPAHDRALARHGVPTSEVTAAARAHAARFARAGLAALRA